MSENPEATPIVETEKPKKVFLEVGLSQKWKQDPLIFKEGPMVSKHDMYIGLDYRHGFVQLAKSDARQRQRPGLFVQADAQATPFPNESIDTVYFGNVFGSPAEGREQILQEARRVLKPDGTLVIFENITPEVADDWAAPKSPVKVMLKDKLGENNFEIIERIQAGDPRWDEKLKVLGITPGTKPPKGSGESFILLARPRNN